MYLMSLNNVDYIILTIFFALIFLVAYLYRHKNTNSRDLLFALPQYEQLLSCHGNLGILELVLAGIAGATLGLNSVYYIWLALIISFVIQAKLTAAYASIATTNFTDYIRHQFGSITGCVVAIMNVVLLFLLATLTIILSFKILQSLLGWNFINSIIGVLGITLVYLLTGGSQAVYYNRIIQGVVILGSFILVAGLGIAKIGGISNLVANLSQLGASQGLGTSYYLYLTKPTYLLLGLVLAISGIGGVTLLNFTSPPVSAGGSTFKSAISLSKFLIALIVVLPGVIAIATPVTANKTSGNKIVTIEAQMADGQTAYIVKALDTSSKPDNSIPGIIPPLINPVTNLVMPNSYDYTLANIIAFRHYLPRQALVIVVVMVLAAFMYSLAGYLIWATRIILGNILVPYNWLQPYGEVGKLWASRGIIIVFGVLATVTAAFILPHYNLLTLIGLILAVLIAPLLALLVVSLLVPKAGAMFIPLLVGMLCAIVLLRVLSSASLVANYALITSISFGLTLLLGLGISQLTKK
jgi:Na+/proline symporter